MVALWWAAGLTVPALMMFPALRGGGKKGKEGSSRKEEADKAWDADGVSFACERVCTSDRLLKRMGGLSKEPTPHTCVTVCGTSASDSCTEACQKAVCVNLHQVPAWNEQCLKKCATECARGRTGPN